MSTHLPVGRFALLTSKGGAGTASLSDFKGQPVVIHLFTGWGGCWPCSEQMEQWQTSPAYGGRVKFVAIGCAGKQQATMMRDRTGIKHATVGYMAERNQGPFWGQLGCNGFIILDGTDRQNVVSKCTSAFLSVRELAFAHVETVLDAVLSGAPVPPVCVGQYVCIHGLKGQPVNGQLGLCVSQAPSLDGDAGVQLLKGQRKLRVNLANLVVVSEADVEFARQTCEVGQPESEAVEGAWDMGGDSCGDAAGSPANGASGSEERDRGEHDEKEGGSEPEEGDEGGEGEEALAGVAATGVAAMDDEHEKCVAALHALAQVRSVAALAAVLRELEAHFKHEEETLDTHLYGDVVGAGKGKPKSKGSEGFSVASSTRKTHFADHTRMLAAVRAEVERAARAAGKGGEGQRGTVGAAFVRELLRDFHSHADTYDNNYAADLCSALGLAAPK